MYIHHPVAIGTNTNYGGLLNVNGDIVLTGQVQQPSDRRLKENIVNLDKKQAMDRLNRLRIVQYDYKVRFIFYSFLSSFSPSCLPQISLLQ